MENRTEILSIKEIRDVLEAVEESLSYALDHGQMLKKGYDPRGDALQSVKWALRAIKAARAENGTVRSIQGFTANAVARLKTALLSLTPPSDTYDHSFPEVRAVKRAIALLSPIIKNLGPRTAYPRKTRRSKQRLTSNQKTGRRPRFWVSVKKGSFTNFFTGFDRDISTGGLFIATYNIYPAGTEIEVKVELPGGRVLVSGARVSWTRDHSATATPGMGVVFHRLTPAAQTEINQFIARHDSIFYDAV